VAAVDPSLPSLDRAAVSRAAVRLAGPLGSRCDLSAYRLAGGTALAWELDHRRSDDLDFFTRVPGLLDETEQRRIEAELRPLDPDAHIDISQPQTIHAVVLGCRLSLFGLGGQWLSQPVQVAEGFGVATVQEIAAMKLIAVSTRSAKKDFFDLHALYQRGYSGERMFAALSRMHPGEIDLDVGYHVVRALTDFSDAELDPDPIVLNGATWFEARRTAERLAADLKRHLSDLRKSG
jgi:hypothetical protein